MDYPPRASFGAIKPKHLTITDITTGDATANSQEAFARIAERMRRENPNWEPGSAQRAIANGWGKPRAEPKKPVPRTRAIACPRCMQTSYTSNPLARVCNECRADHDRDLRLARQRRAVELRRERHGPEHLGE